MELALSLGGDHSSNPFSNFQNSKTSLLLKSVVGGGGGGGGGNTNKTSNCMGLGLVLCGRPPKAADHEDKEEEDINDDVEDDDNRKKEEEEESEDVEEEQEEEEERNNPVPVQQLDLLPFSPVPRPLQCQFPTHSQFGLRFPWLVSSENLLSSEPGSSDGRPQAKRSFRDEAVAAAATAEDQSSPNSAMSSFMEFTLSYNNNNNKRPLVQEGIIGSDDPTAERGGASKGSDDDENGSSGTRKKLRLSKDQSAFLEESFKEHHTLNPKQKLALAKQLNLRPRQVEVWFQNRRARTKLKQTEVDCEYLKRCCETLTEENRRLQKELQELRALKTTSHPFYMQHLPATTLTMCPSCERVATTTTTTTNTTNNITRPTSDGPPTTDLTLLSKPQQQRQQAASQL